VSDDWAPGDLALCVRTTQTGAARKGRIYTVREVDVHPYSGRVGLLLQEVVSQVGWRGGFLATRFRKIRPHTPDAEDAETIRLLTGKPARVLTLNDQPSDHAGRDFADRFGVIGSGGRVHGQLNSAGSAQHHGD
jgi:hypothetical protein